jgi:hypothetical protein
MGLLWYGEQKRWGENALLCGSCSIARNEHNGPNGVRDFELSSLGFARDRRGVVAVQATLIPPDADTGSGFKVEFFENVLHVFLNGARAALQDFPDFVVALSRDDPLHDFQFPSGQIRRLCLGYAQTS